MPLEVIENITQVEAENRERKTAAEAKAKQIIADAQRDGAETRAEAKGDEISRAAQAEGETLRREAESRLDAAADLIVGRVVKD